MADMMKNALVIGVGAERGLGARISARFAREGLHVFVAGRTAHSLERVVQQIRAVGGAATAVVALEVVSVPPAKTKVELVTPP